MGNKLSIVIPVYCGARTIGPLVKRLKQSLGSLYELEIVLVNDGSPDDSGEVCKEIARNDSTVKYIDLSRNFSEHNAVMAGLNFSTGDYVVIMDDDFQNPPEEVTKLVDEIRKGYDVVYTYYEKKMHSFFRNLGSKFNDLVATILIGKPKDLYLSSFKIMNRFLVKELVKYKGPFPYIDGLVFRITKNYSKVLVQHNPRAFGKSGYTLKKLVSLWLNMFTNFSILPLRIASLLGLVISVIGIIIAFLFVLEKLRRPNLSPGWASMIVSLFIIGGVQLFALGMIGEYLGRLFLKDTGQPQFVVRETVNCPKEEEKK